jgi:hypothetical protein
MGADHIERLTRRQLKPLSSPPHLLLVDRNKYRNAGYDGLIGENNRENFVVSFQIIWRLFSTLFGVSC